MKFREATTDDVKQIQVVRNLVKENQLSNPALVPDKDCQEYLTVRGRGWVCESDNQIVGFAIADLVGKNIWALFVDPQQERKGIGRKLHNMMMDWYFSQTQEAVWLSTSPKTRAEDFYRRAGWRETGIYGKGEIKFEMTYKEYLQHKAKQG